MSLRRAIVRISSGPTASRPWIRRSERLSTSATATASPSRGALALMRLGGDELIERVGQPGEIGQLAGRCRAGALAETVDPDRAQAELVHGSDVVEEARRDVDVAFPRRRGAREELLPVAVSGFVRADLRGDDLELERHA